VPTQAGKGGDGYNYSINGTNLYYAGGGGGGYDYGGNVGAGGAGGGGAGGVPGVAGTNGLGGGGGGGAGGGGAGQGGKGGDGVVILSYPALQFVTVGGKVVTSKGVDIPNATIYLIYGGALWGNTSSAVNCGNWSFNMGLQNLTKNLTVVGLNPNNISQGGAAYPFIIQ
jgi:hypothetical protein